MSKTPKETHPDLREYTRIEKQNAPEGSHPAAKAAFKKPRGKTTQNTRSREFARIDHGRRA